MCIQRGPVVQESGSFGQAMPPTLLLLPSHPPQMVGTVHRTQDLPSRAHPRNPAAGSGSGGVAGEGGAGPGAGRLPGECGAHSGSDAAATWAASPRRREMNRNGGASGDRRKAQRGRLGQVVPTPPKVGRLVASRRLQGASRSSECFGCSLCEFSSGT